MTGKLLLAFGPLALERIGPEPYERYTPRTLTTHAELAREIERVRGEGVAFGREEREAGLNAVGAPVLGRERGLEAMLSIQGPATGSTSAACRAWPPCSSRPPARSAPRSAGSA